MKAMVLEKERNMRRILFVVTVCVLALAATAPIAVAGDVDPGGVRLRRMVDDYLASGDATGDEESMLQRAQASNGPIDRTLAQFLCKVESVTIIGGGIWNARRKADPCGYVRLGTTEIDYCVLYSTKCDHFLWSEDCLADQHCPRIPKR